MKRSGRQEPIRAELSEPLIDVCFVQSGAAAEASEGERQGLRGQAGDGGGATDPTSQSQVRLLSFFNVM